jgi:hypothetical protein
VETGGGNAVDGRDGDHRAAGALADDPLARMYRLCHIAAPVFGAEGRVILALTLTTAAAPRRPQASGTQAPSRILFGTLTAETDGGR